MVFSKILGNAGEVKVEKLQSEYGVLIVDGERIEAGFRVIRDTFLFTNKRLIIIDVQGVTGRKKEYLSIPYSKITMYSIESTGSFDLDAELKIWVSSDSTPIEKKFNSKSNVYTIQRILSEHLL